MEAVSMTTIFAPGRTELAGNHTDHQKGRILASAVNYGITAVCRPIPGRTIRIKSKGFSNIEVKLSNLRPNPEEFGKSIGL